MSNHVSRRKFVASLGMLAAALPLGASAFDFIPSAGKGFNFMLLGDLHFDKLEHHDMEYIKAKYPNDLEQIKNYSRVTRDNLPLLMQEVKQKGTALNADFYLQLGDFVEGLCGSEALAQQQTGEFISYVADQQLNRPFLVIKGNHDITGEGAPQTYIKTVLPWQSREHKQQTQAANATFVHKNTRFILFDAYAPDESLEWLKKVLVEHKEKTLFFCIHMPVVPFNARSNWHIFAKPTQQKKREELLNLLGRHKAIVLCGHLHKTSILKRSTAEGDFVQVCIGSVIPAPDAAVKDHLQGLDAYNTDLVNLEPKFAPASLQERKDNLANEKPFIRHFEYADFCGHATMQVTDKNEAVIAIHANVDKAPWRTINLTELLYAAK
ncbi:metallophosphoesterase [Chitinophaga sp. SYP-B3965]|uniref:metallophosphoesterase family protein n=1 Tax=Chitinophaga sp. SYP-B3965 TaxID=2663120 RepID=UPI001299F057|nr:metallophosphoesterase [Chitinophaga sp. SYP-B3965]MRG43816.1 metallophosphoesterase [Chitinophaga sp. SYP-B3965]